MKGQREFGSSPELKVHWKTVLSSHDAYHRFFRDGKWEMSELWKEGARMLVDACRPKGRITLYMDDTLFHKSGRKIMGAKLVEGCSGLYGSGRDRKGYGPQTSLSVRSGLIRPGKVSRLPFQ